MTPQSTFVALVRNYTETEGAESFALGDPVSGYTGFAAAIAPGECFYYSAIGVDRPAEREVGRGIMREDGRIGRNPISGVLTSFSPGTKTLALIAAAE